MTPRKPVARKVLTFRLVVEEESGYTNNYLFAYLYRGKSKSHIDGICDDWCQALGVKPGEYAVTLKPVAPKAKAKRKRSK